MKSDLARAAEADDEVDETVNVSSALIVDGSAPEAAREVGSDGAVVIDHPARPIRELLVDI